ncbi:MAG TPA: ferritin family protein [Candidatus Deferrimicrobiaceae bacterium]
MNVFEYAMKMELDGKAYYEKLALETENAGLKTILTNLAADEQKHYETFKALKGGMSAQVAESWTLENNKNLFERLIADKAASATLVKSLDGYRHGMENEAESAKFYEDAAKKEGNAEVATLLLRIAAEERDHYRILENLYQYTLAPENFLAWGEFSNLKEL